MAEQLLCIQQRPDLMVLVARFDGYAGHRLAGRVDDPAGNRSKRDHLDDDRLRLYKVSKRRDMDVATISAAILVKRDRDSIVDARVAYGGAGPRVLRLQQTEAFLAGRVFDEESFSEAGRIAEGEIAPINDIRGSSEFRRELARALPLKFYHECSR